MTEPIVPFTRWTPKDVATLVQLAEAGARWIDVATATGRAIESCQMKWHAIATGGQREMRAAAIAAKRGGRPPVAATAPIARPKPMTAPLALPGPRTVTAAVFGDPLPGRSALDRRIAGVIDASAPDRRQAAQQPLRPTLPTEPLR